MIKSPHILLASNNCRKMKNNLSGIIDQNAIIAIENEIKANIAGLFIFGLSHFSFASSQEVKYWRQKVSRYYYAGYNMSRAIWMSCDGHYSTDSTDHKKVVQLPNDFVNYNLYSTKLADLREDRNLCDYDHTAVITDLIESPGNDEVMLNEFRVECIRYLGAKGITI